MTTATVGSVRRAVRAVRERVRSAAVEYPAHGWGVLPGSVWDGERYTLGHTASPADGLRPVILSGRTLRTAREVWSWWSVAPYAVLARVGEDFDVLTAPADLVSAALRSPDSAAGACPVMLSPDRTSAMLLLRPGSRLRWELRTVPGVILLPVGALVALPPTVTGEGEWSWWVDPFDGYRPGLPGAVQKALSAAAAALRASGTATRRGGRR